ncbi:hypothetical protein ACQP1O_43150 (plasmid) [Nocardia sp. CA-151230]|uniref:hypothetical protein n=1 Tax=Nocardia sp. CA-151230 TaxID=3239982 RepID=UPI003D8FDB07
MSYTRSLERQVVQPAGDLIRSQHQTLAVAGTFCTCDHCAPTENAKAERRALSAAVAERRSNRTD